MARFEDNRPVRSDKYQYKIREISVDHENMGWATNAHHLYHDLNPYEYNERVLELEQQLRDEMWKIAQTALTENQTKILKLRMDGYTQMEISKMLDCNQSSITKCLMGNSIYSKVNGKKVNTHGGVVKKLRKLCLKNEKIVKILKEINDLQQEKM